MAFALLTALVTGTMYGLFALGIVLVYRGTRVINFAAPAVGSLGLYIAHEAHVERGVPWVTAAIIGVLIAGVVSLAFERFIVRRMHDASALAIAVATIGLMLLIISSELVVFGGSPRNLPGPVGGSPFSLLGVPVTWTKLLAVFVALVLAGALTQFLRRTDFGLGVQAAAMDPEAVRLVGVRLHEVNAFVWAVGGMLPVIAALFVLPSIGGFAPGTVTATFFVPAIAGALIGGLDDLTGAFIGGIAVGLIASLSEYAVLTLQWDLPGARHMIVLLAIVATLLVVPGGLAGRLRPLVGGTR